MKQCSCKEKIRWFSSVLILFGSLYALYRWWFNPWHRCWGATTDEVKRELPGDKRLSSPLYNTTRAIQIAASPAQVWQWLIQLGQGRGGFYSYDFLENWMGLDIHSRDEIVPEYQNVHVGDVIPLEPQGSGYTVIELQPSRLLLLYTDGNGTGEINRMFREIGVATTWAFVLNEQSDGSTRLLVRWRATLKRFQSLYAFFLGLVLEPIEFLMEQKMMRGIKKRAETM